MTHRDPRPAKRRLIALTTGDDTRQPAWHDLVAVEPDLAEELDRPMFLVVAADR